MRNKYQIEAATLPRATLLRKLREAEAALKWHLDYYRSPAAGNRSSDGLVSLDRQLHDLEQQVEVYFAEIERRKDGAAEPGVTPSPAKPQATPDAAPKSNQPYVEEDGVPIYIRENGIIRRWRPGDPV